MESAHNAPLPPLNAVHAASPAVAVQAADALPLVSALAQPVNAVPIDSHLHDGSPFLYKKFIKKYIKTQTRLEHTRGSNLVGRSRQLQPVTGHDDYSVLVYQLTNSGHHAISTMLLRN
jgi:hypothetical protein